jgi:hypothetical protein
MMALMKDKKPNNYQSGFIFQVATSGQGDPDKPAHITNMK